MRPRCSASSVARLTSSAIVRELVLLDLERGDRLAELRCAPWRTRAPTRSTRAPRRPRPRRCRSAPRSGTTAARAAPWPRAASRRPGRRTSSSSSSEVTEARSESFWWMSCVVKPFVPGGDEEAAHARRRSCAHTTATSATEPFVIHIFWPCRIQSSPSRRARVRIEPGSEPESGSVRPKQPIASPAAIRGSHSCFCSSEPQRQIAYIASEPCTDTSERTPRVARLELQARQAVRGRARARAAVALEVHAEHAELAQLARQLERDARLLEPLADVRHDLVLHELADGVADHALLVAEQAVDGEEVARAQVGAGGGGGHGLLRSSIFEDRRS